ncbi:hypothetical protein SDC9_168745 [bioreactor metagenome]|uniref:CCA-adding enzyme C-terminal domain-containing protein n=1 Tax=bioreactor metagenome TaxID=1076179 RepID=A0A645G5G5_9ZZZZ
MVLLIPLGEPDAAEVANRLHLNSLILEAIQKACPIWRDREMLEPLPASQFCRHLNGLPVTGGFALYILAKTGIFKEKLDKYFSKWRFVSPFTDGNRLKEMGLQPGPKYSEILERLRSAWIEGEVNSQVEEEKLLTQLLD